MIYYISENTLFLDEIYTHIFIYSVTELISGGLLFILLGLYSFSVLSILAYVDYKYKVVPTILFIVWFLGALLLHIVLLTQTNTVSIEVYLIQLFVTMVFMTIFCIGFYISNSGLGDIYTIITLGFSVVPFTYPTEIHREIVVYSMFVEIILLIGVLYCFIILYYRHNIYQPMIRERLYRVSSNNTSGLVTLSVKKYPVITIEELDTYFKSVSNPSEITETSINKFYSTHPEYIKPSVKNLQSIYKELYSNTFNISITIPFITYVWIATTIYIVYLIAQFILF